MVLFLLLFLIAIALGLVGVLAKGLLFLLIIGVVLFVLDLALAGLRLRRSGARPVR